MEVWLRANPRPFYGGALLFLLMIAVLGAYSYFVPSGGLWGATKWASMGIGLVLRLGVLKFVLLARQPIVTYEKGNLRLSLFFGSPMEIPVEIVECFFSGQGSAMMRDGQGKEAEAKTVILRLAESAKEWHHRDVPATMGHWCEGYVTIRGTYCEPLVPEVFARLNSRLTAAHKESRASVKASVA